MRAQQDKAFRRVINQADVCLPDGVGLLWAARRLGCPLRERVAGSTLTVQLAERAAQSGWRVYFLGAAPGVADKAAEILQSRFPGLIVAGTWAGSPSPDEQASIVERVRDAAPDILLVAYGAPAQDVWIARNQPLLRVPVAMGVGGSLDFIAGVAKRAPVWIQRIGLEWLYRLVREPWRWRRQLALPRFVWHVLCARR
jgi:N-acetylglucosaminyldiphosphoundecaprenol N-acetyl-beta-D-mannosaminyltransferase